jgi:hypothetical protein
MPQKHYTYPQKNAHYTLLGVVLLIFLNSCGPSIELPASFNQEVWKEDRNGCRSERIEMAEDIKNIGDQFIGLREHEIIKYFGKPDKEALKRRMNKTYIYYLHPSERCDSLSESSSSLRIEFESLGRVRLVTLQKSGV